MFSPFYSSICWCIEWNNSQKVQSHCKECDEAQRLYPTTSNSNNCCNNNNKSPSSSNSKTSKEPSSQKKKLQLSPSYETAETELVDNDDDDDDRNECSICYETFHRGDVVSWSPASAWNECGHVFHHECVKEWLLHHDSCPCCRTVFLPVDQSNSDNKSSCPQQPLREWIEQRAHRVRTTYYCLQEGLVTLDAVPEDRELKRHVNSGTVKPAVLAQLRKSRATTATETVNDDDTSSEQLFVMQHHNRSRSNISPLSSAVAPQPLRMTDSVVDIELCMQQLRSLPSHALDDDDDEAVAMNRIRAGESSTATTTHAHATPPPQPLHMSNAVVDIELCMQQLRYLSSSDSEEDTVATPLRETVSF